jgi:hypothetical protein
MPMFHDVLEVWGWGKRARLPTTRSTARFKRALRGWGPVSRQDLESLYEQSTVVLNLQDVQMHGAWNPQTFDVMALGVPQVVLNQDAVAIFDHPPKCAWTPDEIARQVQRLAADPEQEYWRAGAREIDERHRWHHRAMRLIAEVVPNRMNYSVPQTERTTAWIAR